MLNVVTTFIHNTLEPIIGSMSLVNIFELLFIAFILFSLYKKFIRNSQSELLFKGLLILVLTWLFSEILVMVDLRILGGFLRAIVALITLSLIVVFQPELRRFLGYLGQPGFLRRIFSQYDYNHETTEKEINLVKEIIEAVKYMAKTKTGALIVFNRSCEHGAYSEVGTVLDAKVSAELILTVFHPNTPLHDGAMIVEGNKIHSAGALLPLTEDPKLSWKYGTRHRAAIGMSEISDAACLVVSEETGDVSVCMDGLLRKYEDLTTLKSDLEAILGIKCAPEENVRHKNLFDIIRKK